MHRFRNKASLFVVSQIRLQSSQSSSPSQPPSANGWRQQVVERDDNLNDAPSPGGVKSAFSDKTIASSAILTEKGFEESKKAMGGGVGKTKTSSKSAQQTEAAFREDVESSTFSPIDFYRRRIAYLALVRSRKGWVPLASYGTLLYGLSFFGPLAMPQVLTAGAAIALLNKFVVAGSSSKWLKLAKGAANKAVVELSGNSTNNFERLPLYRQVAVITGASGALGREVAEQLQSLGAMVIVTHIPGTKPFFEGHNDIVEGKVDNRKAATIITQLSPPNNTLPMRSYPLDLADRNSVRSFCGYLTNENSNSSSAVPKIDILVLGAGIHEPRYVPTKHNTDRHIEINYLGQFLLTESLLPLVRRSHYSGVGINGFGLPTAADAPAPPSSTFSPSSAFSGLRGGRIVYVSCTLHSLIGQKTLHRNIATAYSGEESANTSSTQQGPLSSAPSTQTQSPSSYKAKWLKEGDDSYIHSILYAVSKLGNIYHTQSLHERRYVGIDGALNTNKEAASNVSNKALRPYAAACAILPTFQSHLSRKLDGEQIPAAVAESRAASGLNEDGSLKEENKDGSSKKGPSNGSQVTLSLIGSTSAPISDESKVQSFVPSSLIGALWRQTPSQAAETVLDVCLRPDIVSGGFYHENREMSQAKVARPLPGASPKSFWQRIIPTPASCFEVLSAGANNVRMRNSLVGWAAQQTRSYTIDVSPFEKKTGNHGGKK